MSELFAWLTPGGDTVDLPGEERELRAGEASAEQPREAAAGDRRVAVASADITRQCLDLGLPDGIAVDLVPVLLGGGTCGPAAEMLHDETGLAEALQRHRHRHRHRHRPELPGALLPGARLGRRR